ncbi:hypothetical protein [Grimontia celer]|nr:hypothetical protein [Grimontia celer]
MMKHWILALALFCPSLVMAEIRLDKSDIGDVSVTSMLVVSGNNLSNTDAIAVIRADDTKNPGYADRANIERVIPPGEFNIEVPFASLRTPGGRSLDLKSLQQIIIFPGRAERGFALTGARVMTPKPLGKNIFAWDLGPSGSAIWPGFQPLTPNSPMVTGRSIHPIDRSTRMQAADALTFDGIRGIDTLTLPLPAGNWQVTLWLRDAGEWEFLPHPLKREILVDGKAVYRQNLSPKNWIDNVYLGLREIKVSPESSSWDHFGARKSDRVTFDIKSTGKPVKVTLKGDSPDAQFVSGILAEPADNPLVLEMLTRQRKLWWDRNWPVAAWTKWPTGQPKLSTKEKTVSAAPGTSVLIPMEFEQGNLPGAPMVMLKQPSQEKGRLSASWHWSQWQLTRTHLSSTLLAPNDNYLRHGLMPENQGVALPRRLMVRVDVPEAQAPGDYQGEVQVILQGKILKAPFNVSVLDVSLPALEKPVGIYLEKQVQFGWFKELTAIGDMAMVCDLKFLRKLGLTGISPPFATPHNEDTQKEFDALSDNLNMLGFTSAMAYAPAKRLSQSIGVGNAANVVADIESRYKQRLQPTPYWSIADEPSNPGNVDLFKEMYQSFSMLAPDAKLAGHLNSDHDKEYLPMFDLVLVNDGFGINVDQVKETQKDDREVWLYNLPNPRAASGYYLWHSGADGFLKWHGRMPTADPFDPTDGREFDVQMLYPSANPCPEEPDIHTDLYEIMEGIVDYRWILWLEETAKSDSNARLLLASLKQELPDKWNRMREVDTRTMDTWRNKIMDLAR